MNEQSKLDFTWECNECGAKEYTSAVSEEDVHTYLACGSCGGVEFHREYHQAVEGGIVRPGGGSGSAIGMV